MAENLGDDRDYPSIIENGRGETGKALELSAVQVGVGVDVDVSFGKQMVHVVLIMDGLGCLENGECCQKSQ